MPKPLQTALFFLPFVIFTAAAYVTKEFYPLSSFPMYSKFDERTYYTYLRSADGEELPTMPTIRMYASDLKKRYGDG
ncbi:MAG: hypothetical protein HKN23_20440, partial [Verrucomicrobiales bacterium]|nr:hypothetical protein [Verrucomicrobiales bacterium]